MSFPTDRTARRDVHLVRSSEVRPSAHEASTKQGSLQGRVAVDVRQIPGQGSGDPLRGVAQELQEHGYTAKSGAGAVVITAHVDNSRSGVPLAKQTIGPGGHQQVGTRKPN